MFAKPEGLGMKGKDSLCWRVSRRGQVMGSTPLLPLTSCFWPLKVAAEMEGHLGEGGGATLSSTVAPSWKGPLLLLGAHFSLLLPEPLLLTNPFSMYVPV